MVTSASITMPRLSVLPSIASRPTVSSETCGKCCVGWSLPKTRKNVPSRAAAYGIRE